MTRLRTWNGSQISSQINAAGATFGAVTSAIGSASQLGSALGSALNSGDVGSAMRSINLPAGGEAVGDIVSAISLFSSDADPNDWRVRLSIPTWISFRNSPVLKPLVNAGGLIFPYTPTITIKSSANYSPEKVTHNNYPFQVYKNSEPGSIQITAPMNVEDQEQALYWIGSMHYLRSVTKMFSGTDLKAGNPPPIVFLNGYGSYVFKNVPVVITQFSCDLSADCDYISTEVVGSTVSGIGGISETISDIASTLGLSGVSNLIGGIGQVAGAAGSFGIGGTTSGGLAYIPTKSTFSVTLTPVYSRTNVRRFSLDTFVTGGYLNNYFGYI